VTWQKFFDLGPLSSHPHNLFYAYAAVWILQGGYLAWIAKNWLTTSKTRR
jgi:hypothetical protein